MANATISELAKVVGVAVEKLLSQVKEAGLPHTEAGDVISNEDKNTLLQFLRSSHGERDEAVAPRKITLNRKTVGTLKAASGHGRGKTVNVEVRKKRTYVKRSEVEEEVPEEKVEEDPNEEVKSQEAEPADLADAGRKADEKVAEDGATETNKKRRSRTRWCLNRRPSRWRLTVRTNRVLSVSNRKRRKKVMDKMKNVRRLLETLRVSLRSELRRTFM